VLSLIAFILRVVDRGVPRDEIIYVVRGEMRFGNKVLSAGSSVYIPGNTYYSFTAGAGGLRIVNFRARCDVSFYAPD
jgi:hypothetical protein